MIVRINKRWSITS